MQEEKTGGRMLKIRHGFDAKHNEDFIPDAVYG
jgi:hypothetical protein